MRSDEIITDYINTFEWLNNQIKHFETEVPTHVLAYKFLKNAELPNEKQQLTQATEVFLTYENMRKHLKAIFDSYTSS